MVQLCPGCGTKIPKFTKPTTPQQFLIGGWTCSNCGYEVDWLGREVKKSQPSSPSKGTKLMTQVCPGCGMQKFTKTRTLQQSLIGGWTCSNCGYEIDWLGKEVKKSQPSSSSIGTKSKNLEQHQPSQVEVTRQTPLSGGFVFIGDVNTNEQTVVIGKDEVPLDNKFGSSILESTHKFSQKATRTIRLNRSNDIAGQFKAQILTVLETEVRASLAQSLGIDLQQEEFREVTLRLSADPGKSVLYRIIWKQTQRSGEVEINIRNQIIRVPYVAVYGLSYSVESHELRSNDLYK